MRKAQFLELDALFAIAILIGGILLLKGLYIHPYDAPQLENTAMSAIHTLQTRTVGTIGDPALNALRTQLSGTGIAIDENETIARQLTMLLIEAEEPGAERATIMQAMEDLSRAAMQGLTRPGEHYNITVLSADQRYTIASSDANATLATQARTMLSGLEVDRSIFGYTATAYLSDANSQQASYYRFGGFVGQGNITATLELPEAPIAFTLEGDFHDDFTISVNGNPPCTTITIPADPDPFEDITQEDITSDCLADLAVGKNLVTINFTGDDIDQHYIGGGYLKATYLSDQTYTTPSTVTKNYTLPGIHGIFNLYDAITIPGRLQSMTISLHYFSNHTDSNNTVFFTLGDRVLHTDNTSVDEQRITITDADILSAGIDYGDYENQTIPLRFGYDNGSLELLASNVVEAVIVTDVSGSMNWTFSSDNVIGTERSCTSPDLYDLSTKRITVAQCANKNFTRLILNEPNQILAPNRVGLASYDGNVDASLPLTNDELLINQSIDAYDDPDGYTCICCGILEGLEQFTEDPSFDPSDGTFTRAMLVMTDGVANSVSQHCRNTLDNYYPLVTGVGDLDGRDGPNQAGDYAVAAANYSYREYNISIFVVGFGTMQRIHNETLRAMAAVENMSHYHLADGPQALAQIYNDIARDIIRIADYNAQIISFDVEVNDSSIYPDSYIEYTYAPNPLPNLRGKLLIDGERMPFTNGDPCTQTNLNFPLALDPVDGSILSYSGNYWTDYLKVNEHDLYNLTRYGTDYQFLGDPFSIGIPAGVMDRGPNEFSLRTAESPTNAIDCSPHNKLLYKATVDNTLALSDIYPEADGCNWTVDILGAATNIVLPEGYAGPNTCTYRAGPVISYDDQDAWQALGHLLFTSFDIDTDGSVDIDFAQQNLDLHLQQQQGIPYLWGPALLEVTVWR